ncbi:MAG: competence/damage-inducible protein A, partial [Deltaproteobacteria bacterium]|nr:competence/damage-inducible protein A [Deltaproteobacteria bacterium]
MIAELLSTGDEIRTGALIDANSAYIAERVEMSGIPVVRHTTVGDDLKELVTVLQEIGSRADIAVVTGGLGPTEDDLTAESAAEAAGVVRDLDSVALKMIEHFFEKFGRPMSTSNRKQAYLPRGAIRLDNRIGTAPGFLLKIGRCRFFFLPGVPIEM